MDNFFNVRKSAGKISGVGIRSLSARCGEEENEAETALGWGKEAIYKDRVRRQEGGAI